MFYKPLRNVKLESFWDVMNYSLPVLGHTMPEQKGYFYFQDQILFITENGKVYLTPAREEIPDILEKEGYSKIEFFLPYKDREFVEDLWKLKESEEYQWLIRMAEEEKFNAMFEQARNLAQEKEIQKVKIDMEEIEDFKDISGRIEEFEGNVYSSLANNKFDRMSQENIGTYIRVNDKVILVCEEYGRTFIIKMKTRELANVFVGRLAKAGYTRTLFPWQYVQEKKESIISNYL